jgi:hypothetical protein
MNPASVGESRQRQVPELPVRLDIVSVTMGFPTG